MIRFQAFRGTITMINDFWINGNEEFAGCFKLMSVENEDGTLVNFVVGPATYFVEHVLVQVGDRVIGFYDANVPTPLIFPPQLRAIVMAKDTPYKIIVMCMGSKIENFIPIFERDQAPYRDCQHMVSSIQLIYVK